MNRLVMLVILAAAPVGPLAAQHDHGQSNQPARPSYSDLVKRDIKALGEEEIRELLEGEGMGLALAAELNKYPGPKHALEFAHELGLEHSQVERITALRDSMWVEVKALGAQIVDAERRLDRLFRDRTIADPALGATTQEIGRLQGALRYAHLRAHLAITAVLSANQIDRYQVLRGYRPINE